MPKTRTLLQTLKMSHWSLVLYCIRLLKLSRAGNFTSVPLPCIYFWLAWVLFHVWSALTSILGLNSFLGLQHPQTLKNTLHLFIFSNLYLISYKSKSQLHCKWKFFTVFVCFFFPEMQILHRKYNLLSFLRIGMNFSDRFEASEINLQIPTLKL